MIGRAIEALYLSALCLIPLVFGGRSFFYWFSEPKQYLLHLIAGLIALLWTFELATRTNPQPAQLSKSKYYGIIKIAGLLVALTVISALLSPYPRWSLLGRDANNPGGEAIAVLSYAVIGAAIALRVTNVSQLARILWTITLTGGLTSVYGIAQYAGWDGLGWGAGQLEVYSSLGNPIYFGSYLILAGGACLMLWAMGEATGAKVIPLIVCTGLIGSGFNIAGGLGPRIAAAVLIIGIAYVASVKLRYQMKAGKQLGRPLDIGPEPVSWFNPRRHVAWGVSLFLTGTALSFWAVNGAPGATQVANTEQQAGYIELGGSYTELSTGDGPARSGVTQAAVPSTFRSRVNVWKAGWQLYSGDQPWIGPDRFHWARQWFGYGPQMAYYAIPLTLGPQHEFLTYDNAHNSWVQALIETGALSVGLTVLLLLYAGIVLFKLWRDKEAESWLRLTAAVLGVVLVARAVEQLTGLARISDSLTWWALLGCVVVLQRLRHASA